MAAALVSATIDTAYVRLIDQWPAASPIVAPERATAGTLGASAGHNVATRKYPLGSKFMVSASPDSTSLSTFVYLRTGTQAGCGTALGAGSVVGLAAAGDAYNTGTGHYVVNGDPDLQQAVAATTNPGVSAAIAISAMTDGYYGWFWCGGPAPEDLIALLKYSTGTTRATIRCYTTATDGTSNDLRGVLTIGDDVTADRMALVDIIPEVAAFSGVTALPFALLSKAPTHI